MEKNMIKMDEILKNKQYTNKNLNTKIIGKRRKVIKDFFWSVVDK